MLGIGDWGLGIGDWEQSQNPKHQITITNPQKIKKIKINKKKKKKKKKK